jgi:hypothetical protein
VDDLAAVATALNGRPRKTLGWKALVGFRGVEGRERVAVARDF